MNSLKIRARISIILISIAAAMILPFTPANAQPPIVDSLDPNIGHLGEQDIPVLVYGSSFEDGAQVFFSDLGISIDGPVIFINSATLALVIDISMLANPGGVDVYVINPDTQQGVLPDGFFIFEPIAPEPQAVIPPSAYQGELILPVAITGEYLYTVTSVDFGAGITVLSIEDITSTQIDCIINIAWSAVPGFRTITVDGLAGPGILVDGFEVLLYPPPELTLLIPNSAMQGESSLSVAITGDYLDTVTTVDFGAGITVDSIDLITKMQIDCTITIAWSAVPGFRTITVDGIAGPGNLIDGFEVLLHPPPEITVVFPDSEYQGHSDILVVMGGNYLDTVTSVDFGAGITVESFEIISDMQIDCYISIDWFAVPGFRTITLDGLAGPGSLIDGFEVLMHPPPEITSVIPDVGYQGDSSLPVIITGDYFDTVTSGDFGSGITVESIDNITETQIDCTISIDWFAIPGFRTITLDGIAGPGTLIDGFEVLQHVAPTITSVDPDFGYQGELGKILTVAGSGFLEGIDFWFLPSGNIDIINIQYDFLNQVTLTVDIHFDALTILYDLDCDNLDGQSGSLPGAFDVQIPSPSITGIDPTFGAQGDTGLPIQITGTFLDTVDTVDLGALITVYNVIVTEFLITAVIDIDVNAVPGFRDVTVSGIWGSDTLPGGFEVTVPPPVLDDVIPGSGTRGDIGLVIDLFGQNLNTIDTIDFGQGITVNSILAAETQITIDIDIAIDADLGFRDVYISGLDGEDTLMGAFEVLIGPVTADFIFPTEGTRGDIGTVVTINGSNLDNIDSADFGTGITIGSVNVINSTEVEVTISIEMDADLGFRDVEISGIDGMAQLPGAYEVLIGDVVLQSVFPSEGYQGELALPVTLGGFNLDLIDTVSMGSDILAVIIGADAMQVYLELDILEEASLGLVDVVISGPNGMDILVGAFDILSAGPSIIDVDPLQGPQGATDYEVIISGMQFDVGAEVIFDNFGITLISATVLSPVAIQCYIDIELDAPLGWLDVTVINPDLKEDTMIDGFEVIEGALVPPVIDWLDPSEGVQGDLGMQVTVNGSDFQDGLTIEFDNPGITIVSYGLIVESFFDVYIDIDFTAAPGPTGVRVTNPDTGQDYLSDAFTVLSFVSPDVGYLDPSEGVQGVVGLQVTVNGLGFQDGLTLEFDNPGISVVGYSSIVHSYFDVFIDIDLTAASGTTGIRLTNPDTGEDYLPNAFTVLEFIDELYVVGMTPDQATQCDTVSAQVTGGGFVAGTEVYLWRGGPVDSFFDITWTVTVPGLIEGDITVHGDAPVGLYDVVVENPDFQTDTLIDAFEVLELVTPPVPPEVDYIDPDEVCLGDEGIQITIQGSNFRPGASVSFENLSAPPDSIYDVFTNFIDENTLETIISVSGEAPEGMWDVRVENPDLQYAYGPQLSVIDCWVPPILEGELVWVDSFFDVFIEVGEGVFTVHHEASTDILNAGDAAYDEVLISITDLLEADGRALTPEHVQLFPSVISPLDPLQQESITVVFDLEVGTAVLPFDTSGVFLGSMIAEDLETDDRVILPISVTVIVGEMEVVEIDPSCLQVDLLSPGGPAGLFLQDIGETGFPDPEEIIDGGIYEVDAFPILQWFGYADGCPGFMETWQASYDLKIVQPISGQQPEDAIWNTPVWEARGITDPFIQYSLGAEPLEGVYLWQITAEVAAVPGSGVVVTPVIPVVSEIWAFYVPPMTTPLPEPELIEGELIWVPDSWQIEGCGMVPATLVISHDLAAQIGPDTPFTLNITDSDTGEYLELDLDFSAIQFSPYNPLPDFGPAAITFGLSIVVSGEMGPDMDASDYAIQVWHGGALLGSMDLDEESEGDFKVDAFVMQYHTWWLLMEARLAHQLECFLMWMYWLDLQALIDADCEEEWEDFWAASADLDVAEEAFDEALEGYLDALDTWIDAITEEMEADQALADARQACHDFFVNSVFSNDVSFEDPGGDGWNYIEGFGGEVGVWFRGEDGAGVLNTFLEMFEEKYQELWDDLREAEQAAEDAGAASEAAEGPLDLASDELDTASDDLDTAQDNFDAALDALLECLEEMGDYQAMADLIEWLFPDCFGEGPGGTDTGLGDDDPGSDDGQPGPPVDGEPGGVPGDEGEGEGEGGSGSGGGSGDGGFEFPKWWPPGFGCPGGYWPGFPGWGMGGFGTGTEDECPCDDCSESWNAVQEARQDYTEAQAALAAAQQAKQDAEQALQDARDAADEAEQIVQAAQNAVDESQHGLDTFMENHVFSGQVSGNPSTGPSTIEYKGVRIYFSDYETFRNIFEIIQPWIDELAETHQANEDALTQAQADKIRAQADVTIAETRVLTAQFDITKAQLDVTMAGSILTLAETLYDACVRETEACRTRNPGCPPYEEPIEWEPDISGEGSGDVYGGTLPGRPPLPYPHPTPAPSPEERREQPGTDDQNGHGALQPPTPESTGSGSRPCRDCDDEYETMIAARQRLSDAEAAVAVVQETFGNATRAVNAAQEEIARAEEIIARIQAQADDLDTEDPNYEELHEQYNAQIDQAGIKLVELKAGLQIKVQYAALAAAAKEEAQAQLQLVRAAYEAAQRAYNSCMQRLRACERANNSEESEAPDGSGGYDVPSPPPGGTFQPPGSTESEGTPGRPWGAFGDIPDDEPEDEPEDESTPGRPFGAFGDIPDDADEDGTGGETDEECPCEDCLDELLALRAAEQAKTDALNAWLDALTAKDEALDDYIDAMMAQLDAAKRVDETQEAVDKIQGKIDSFMADHVSVSGVGGDPSAGPNHFVYKGVHIYFSDYNKFKNEYNLIKDGIDKLNQGLLEAQAELAAAQAALDRANDALGDSRENYLATLAAERSAWNAYVAAVDAYFAALKAYEDCLKAREECIRENPEACEGEEPAPDQGTVTPGGGVRGKAAKQGEESLVDDRSEAEQVVDAGIAEWQQALEEAMDEAHNAQARLAEAGVAVEAAEQAYAENASEVRDRSQELEDWVNEVADFVDGMPDGFAAMTYGPTTSVYDPEDGDPEEEAWLEEHFGFGASDDTWDLLRYPPTDVPDWTVDELVDAYFAYIEASGEAAGAEGRADVLAEELEAWIEEVGGRYVGLDEILDQTDEILADVLSLQNG